MYKFILANQIQFDDTLKSYLSAGITVDQLELTSYYTSLALACHKKHISQFFCCHNMAKTNKDVLLGNVSGNFAESSTSLTVNHVHQRIVSIAEIATTASVGFRNT